MREHGEHMSANDKRTVLFLCTENSVRSQMAEGLLRYVAGDRFDVYSAGLSPKGIHPLTHTVMNEIGIDTSLQSSKDVGIYLGKVGFSHVVFVCDKAERDCPHVFPFTTNRLSWPIEDPTLNGRSDQEQLVRFRQARESLRQRIATWVAEMDRERAYDR
jgi:arsenate reductase